MRFIPLIAFFSCLSLSASAQWYRVDVKLHYLLMKKERFPALPPPVNHSIKRFPPATLKNNTTIYAVQLEHDYAMELAEAEVIKTAQHNMRFRIYNDASYNFSQLASMYIRQNKYTEAKWYLLQSNSISRAQNDDKHTIANLIALAAVKTTLGDYTQAMQDLTEAHNIAMTRGFREDLLLIEKNLLYIKQNKLSPQKTGQPYAELPATGGKRQ